MCIHHTEGSCPLIQTLKAAIQITKPSHGALEAVLGGGRQIASEKVYTRALLLWHICQCSCR